MSDPDIASIRAAIESGMSRKGFSRRRLATEAGVGQTSIRDVLERTDNPGIGTLQKIAGALDMSFSALAGTGTVPLVGKIGAGGQIAYYPEEEEHQLVPRPPVSPGDLIAFQVSGDSMLPKYEPGDVIYVRREHDGVLRTYLGSYCAVHLTDGGTYIKKIVPGSSPGLFTLQSLNAADMPDVEVVWSAPVLFIMPQQSSSAA